MNLALGFFLGLGLGVGIVFVRAFLDTRIRTPQDLRRHGFVPLSCIGLMDGQLKQIENELGVSGGRNRFDLHLIAYHKPMTPIAESYRHLRTNLEDILVDTSLKSFVVTSANPRDGKTVTAANLAISFSQSEKKVLLVDADLRRPAISTKFGLKNTPGLADRVFGRATFDEVIRTEVLPNLDIIGSGTNSGVSSEILGSKKMKDFVAQMTQRYDLVIFDCPPLLVATDAAVLAKETDGAIFVSAAGTTTSGQLKVCAEYLTGIGVKLLGVVVNRFDIRDAAGSYYASYHGYYDYTSGYYGKDIQTKSRKFSSKNN
jgi:capsular exopolysaccharide synthesis family protein